MGRAAVRARSAFRIGMARPRLVSLCLALALLALGDARVIRKEPDEQRLIGWLGEVPREASGGALGRKHGPRDAEYLANDANDSSDVLMRDVDEPTTVTLGHSSSSSNIHELDPSSFDLERDPRVERLSDSPRAYLFRGFLTPEECDHLVVVGEPHLTRSTVVGGAEKTTASDGLTDDVRTSFGTFIPKAYDETFLDIERRVATYAGLPYENQEQLQLLRYRDGQEYKDHNDGLTSPENGGKRVATVLMFLREPTKGGETSFPMATPRAATRERNRIAFDKNELSKCAWRDGRGMAVQPRKGDAVLFFSFHRNEETSKFERPRRRRTRRARRPRREVDRHEVDPRARVRDGRVERAEMRGHARGVRKVGESRRVREEPGVHDRRGDERRVRPELLRRRRRRRRRAGEPLGVADGVLRVVRGHELAAAVRGDARERGRGGSSGARRGGCDDTPTGQALAATKKSSAEGQM